MMLVTLVLALAAVPAQGGCTCPVGGQTTAEQVAKSDWVFLGIPSERIEAKDTDQNVSGNGWGYEHSVKVKRVWKDARAAGAAAFVVSWDECAVSIVPGKTYVFFADKRGTVSACIPPVRFSVAKALVRELDLATAPK